MHVRFSSHLTNDRILFDISAPCKYVLFREFTFLAVFADAHFLSYACFVKVLRGIIDMIRYFSESTLMSIQTVFRVFAVWCNNNSNRFVYNYGKVAGMLSLSGVIRVGVTRGGNWWVSPCFLFLKSGDFLLVIVCVSDDLFHLSSPHRSHLPASFIQCSF